MKAALIAIALATTFARTATSQGSRLFLGGSPTALSTDFSNAIWSEDVLVPGAFYAIMPLTAVSQFMAVDSDLYMDGMFGPGTYLRVRLVATDWAYYSTTPCAHQPGNSGGVPHPAPRSLLTTDFDFTFGAAWGFSEGAPHPALANWTVFGSHPDAYIASLPVGTNHYLPAQRWQLRTRGFSAPWNGCNSSSLTPSFPGYLAFRFTASFY